MGTPVGQCRALWQGSIWSGALLLKGTSRGEAENEQVSSPLHLLLLFLCEVGYRKRGYRKSLQGWEYRQPWRRGEAKEKRTAQE